jgi:L-lactate dehydrogenase complex protein LldE
MNNSDVSLFIPCLVDQVYPEIGLAMAGVLEHLGYRLHYNPEQTCCGQPAFNAGHRSKARKVAETFVDAFNDEAGAIVGPSGSCVGMVRNYYQVLFKDHARLEEALALSRRIFEFSEFLAREKRLDDISGKAAGKIGFHNSCHSYRELGLQDEPFDLMRCISGYDLIEVPGEPVCCGFGGLFSVKYEAIAETMALSRLEQFTSLGVETIVTNDPGCLMHMRQEAVDRGMDVRIIHVAEFIAKAMGVNPVKGLSGAEEKE